MKFKKRFWHHAWKLRNGSHDNNYLQSVWDKHSGKGFEFSALQILKRHEDMDEYEIDFIKELNSFGDGGFNLTVGGEGKKGCPMPESAKKIVGEKNRVHNLGRKHSDATRKRMSMSSPRKKITPENRAALDASRIGSKHTEESKALMSKSHTGKGSVLNNNKAAIVKQMLIGGHTRSEVASKMDISYAVVKSVVDEVAWGHIYIDGWAEFLKNHKDNKQKRKDPLSDEKIRYIRLMLDVGKTQAELSRELNVGNSVISGIKMGRTYKNVK